MHAGVHIQRTEDSDDDSKARKAHCKKVADSVENVPQPPVDEHLKAVNPEEKPQPYSDDEMFNRAAVQWLLETNQVFILLRII
jgi:hypothetical protein